MKVPVTLKMRLGWDDRSLNAPELARRAEAAGVQLISVHGRTRCQFYKGEADWGAVRAVRDAIDIPLVVNGDITSFEKAVTALEMSGADAVMVGRGAQGQPWLPGQIGRRLETGIVEAAPSLAEQLKYIRALYDEVCSHYGLRIGLRHARKHLGWALEIAAQCSRAPALTLKTWRQKVLTSEDPHGVHRSLSKMRSTTLHGALPHDFSRRTSPAVPSDGEAILNALPNPVLLVAPDGRIVDANMAAESFFEISTQFLQRQSLKELVPFGSPLLALIDQVRSSGSPVNEYKVDLGTPRIGGDRQVDLHVAPLTERPGHIVVMLQERTIADKMDRQLTHRSAARSVIALAAMLAHEIKNPLSGIRGAAQLLEQAASSEDRMLTRLICDEADRIVTLVDRMEVFGDDRPVARGPVNIHSVLDHVKRLAQSGFARNIRFVEEYDPSLPPVLANQDQLIQVFLNLVKNAAEAVADLGSDARNPAHHRVPSGRPAVGAGQEIAGVVAARILRQGQRSRRAGRPASEPVRSLRHDQTDRQRAGSCAGGQDRRRSRRHHRMRIPAAEDHFPRAAADVQRRQTFRSKQSRRRFGYAVACLTEHKMRNNNARR